jgi:hypothetical protein
MNIYGFARYLDAKYQFTALAQTTNANSPEAQKAFKFAKECIRTIKDKWLVGPDVKDQSIILWNNSPNKDIQFEMIRELLEIVFDLDANPVFDATNMYRDICRAITLSKHLKDNGVSEIGEILGLRDKGVFNDQRSNKIKNQITGVRTFLRRLDGLFVKARDVLSPYTDAKSKAIIDEVSIGGYEQQKARSLNRQTFLNFMFNPEASKYGLDNEEFLRHLFNQTKLKPYVERLINAVKRGKKPRTAPIILSAHDKFEVLEEKLRNNLDLFDKSEEGFQQQVDLPAQQEKLQEYQSLTSGQQWAKQMQDAKQEKILDKEENPEIYSPEKVEELVQKRDEEHQQKQIEEDRARHIRSDASNFWINQLSKRYL